MIPVRSVALVGLIAAAGPVPASPVACSSVGGAVYTAPVLVPVALRAGDVLTIATPDGATLAVSVEYNGQGGSDDSLCNPAFDGTSCDGFSHVALRSGTYGVEAFNAPGDSFALSCGAAPSGTGPPGTGAIQGAQGAAALASAAGSVTAIGSAINSSLTGSTPVVARRSGLFFSTLGTDSGLTGWASWQGHAFSGAIDGRQQELTLGMDFAVGVDTRLGLFLSAGRSDFDLAVDVSSTAVSFGPYFTTQFGEHYSVTGYALFARPGYDVGGITYDAERRAAGLTANADYMWGNVGLRFFIGVTGVKEAHPAAGGLAARDISLMTGSIGTRATLETGGAVTPYLSIGADYSRLDDGLGGEETQLGPRLGTGFTYDAGAGALSLDLDGGQLLKDTRDLKLRLNYNLNF
ncbi:autotransporter domain-containing protein [Maliponia aquimaris]|uniref:Autotransporter domain-containing protein n=1 Tax=Maliponia aquimaris TaxID=1673631 RepID=A0A238KAP9_9RHOB|nr:autotransporter domain-containing protein [Maliponia aquimaris]SMX39182.1 hypothetical protein MAA8898_01921 [Maliponia aquimaris]